MTNDEKKSNAAAGSQTVRLGDVLSHRSVGIPNSGNTPNGFRHSSFVIRHSSLRSGFTLIELILVMTILTIAVSITAPALANFFRGRTLDSEARRLLALTRQGQSRAVSEGIPMELWINASEGTFGLEAQPSYEATDPKASDFKTDGDIQLEVVNGSAGNPAGTFGTARPTATSS